MARAEEVLAPTAVDRKESRRGESERERGRGGRREIEERERGERGREGRGRISFGTN